MDHPTVKHLMIAVALYAVCLAVLPVFIGLAAATMILGLWLARSRARPEDREDFLVGLLPFIPLSLPLALLATWLAACVALGHPPRAADHPKAIHPVVTELTLLCSVIWLIVNVWFLLAISWLFSAAIACLSRKTRYRRPILVVLMGLAVLFATKYAAETLLPPGWFKDTMSFHRSQPPIVIRSVPM